LEHVSVELVQPPLVPDITALCALQDNKLKKEDKELRNKFDSLVQDIEESFGDRKLKASKIVSYLKFVPEHETKQIVQGSSIRSELFRAQSVEELFFIFHKIWDYLHPGILQCIVNRFGTSSDKDRVEEYMEALRQYRTRVKVRPYVNTVYNLPSIPCMLDKNVSMIMEEEWGEKTLQEVEEYRLQVAAQSKCNSFLIKAQLIRSSIMIMFSISSWIKLDIVGLYPVFSKFGASKVYLNGDYIHDCAHLKVNFLLTLLYY